MALVHHNQMYFFQLKGTSAINSSPSNILKYSFLYQFYDTIVRILKNFCPSMPQYLNIVKQNFFWCLEELEQNNPIW